jgi:hypothetical protein
MEEGRTRLPDHVLDAVLDQLPATPQRRPGWSARRIADMNPIAKYAIATAAVVVIAIVGLNLLGARGTNNVGGSPPSPSPVASPPTSAATSAAPSSSLLPITPSSGAIAPGKYRWTSPSGGEVTFVVQDGWNGRPESSIGKREATTDDVGFGWSTPGTINDVDRVYTDACFSENKLNPIGDTAADLVAALDAQNSTDAVVADVAAGSVTGKRVAIDEAPGVDRSKCRHGADGPLQIWADAAENTYFALAPGHRGLVYVFDVNGQRSVFNAALGPDATAADVAEIDAIVRSLEFSSR